jgi:hypothetical protein
MRAPTRPRSEEPPRRTGVGDVLLDIALRNKPPEALITYLSDHPKKAL